MTKIGFIQFALLLLVSAAYGQKAKYKDIYALLSTKQFEQAEPFLRTYLKQNDDNPNAYLFMGQILQEKAAKNDILKQTKVAVTNMDSAIFYYDKAHKLIDEREVKRNKEYYQSYNRRDLRTGEFGVKLSDVQFDIEKKIEALKERIPQVKMASHFFHLADTTYRRTNALFVSLQQKFTTSQQLYLRADEKTLRDLAFMTTRFDSSTKAFDTYKAACSSLGKTGYDQKITIQEIDDFTKDGRDVSDLYADDVKWWDYGKFAGKTREVIEKEIIPMRHHLITYDMEINKLIEKLKKDSVSVRNDLTKLVDQLLYDQLRKFDPNPLPMVVFGMKTADLAYRSTVIEHAALRDSADIHLQVRLLEQELNLLAKLDSTAANVPAEDFEARAADYSDFIQNAYSSGSVMKSYLRSLKEFGLREQKARKAMLEGYLKALDYVVDGADSIPLTTESQSVFKPLLISPEKFTFGISFRDTTKSIGYFYTITPSRKTDVKAFFPVSHAVFKPSSITSAKGLVYADAAGQIYYLLIFSDKPVQEKFPTTLAKVYRSDGLAWKMDYNLGFVPAELEYVAETGELMIRNAGNQAVVDKNGKLRQ
jgi:hypothetical protein